MIIRIDISHSFNTTCRDLTLDVLSGRASRDNACGLLKHGDAIPTCENLSNLGYFKGIRTCHAKLRYFDWDGQVYLPKVKTGGHQGDPLKMLIFNLTIHHLREHVPIRMNELLKLIHSYGDVFSQSSRRSGQSYTLMDTLRPGSVWRFRSYLSSSMSSTKMLVWSLTSPRPPSSPRASPARLPSM